MPKPLDDIDVVVLSIATPIQVGAYKDKILIDSLSKDGLSSDVLPLLFDILLKKYNIHTIYYINGPGSYMAIKVCYIFLISLCMIKGFKLLSCSGFEFNNNSAIKAINDRYFFNQKDKIVLIIRLLLSYILATKISPIL